MAVSNQQGNPDNSQASGTGSRAQGIGAISQAIGTGSSFNANGPSADPYNQVQQQAQQGAGQYQGLANAAQGRPGAQINNQFQGQSQATMAGAQGKLNDVYNQAGQVANTAHNQFQQNLDQSLQSNLAMANSGRAGSLGAAGAQRAAMNNNAVQAAGAANQSEINYANNEFAGLGLQNGVANTQGQLGLGQYSLEQQDAERQAGLDAAQKAQNDAYQAQMYGLGNQEQATQLAAANGYNNANNATQQINANTSNHNAGAAQDLLGSATSAIGSGLGAVLSDPAVKTDMSDPSWDTPLSADHDGKPMSSGGGGLAMAKSSASSGGGGSYGMMDSAEMADSAGALASDPMLKTEMRSPMGTSGHHSGNLVDNFLAHVDPKVFRYKSPRDEPTSAPTGGQYIGVNANHVAAIPAIGQQLVKQTGRGKALDTGPTISATLAGLGRLHQRVARLERGGR